MDILIIGGSGHVSGALARVALAHGHNTWTVTRNQRPLPDGVRSLVADRHDLAATEAIIGEQNMVWDLVVDCICYEAADMRQDIDLFRRRARQFAFVSTDFVYDPFHRKLPQAEEGSEHYARGGDGSGVSYGSKKRLCEEALIEADTGDMEWTIVRPCHIYGPTSELGCLPLHGRDKQLIDRLRSGETIRLVGGGHFLQQPILADDLAATLLSIGGNDRAHGQIFNAAGPDLIESRQYYQIVADLLGVELTVAELPVQPHLEENPQSAPFLCHRIYDLSRLEAACLSVPSTSMADGLRLHVEGMLARREEAQQ